VINKIQIDFRPLSLLCWPYAAHGDIFIKNSLARTALVRLLPILLIQVPATLHPDKLSGNACIGEILPCRTNQINIPNLDCARPTSIDP